MGCRVGSVGTSPCPGCGEAGLALVAVPWASRPERTSGQPAPPLRGRPDRLAVGRIPGLLQKCQGPDLGP